MSLCALCAQPTLTERDLCVHHLYPHAEIQGDVVVLKERLDEERAVVLLSAGAEKIGVIADPLRSTCLSPGDHILMDPKSGYLLERLPKTDVEDLALEEVLDIGYRDVGGLAAQITAWRGLWIPAAASRNLSTRMSRHGPWPTHAT
jgi:ATP-dependent 26S proteasome regulatory subunit